MFLDFDGGWCGDGHAQPTGKIKINKNKYKKRIREKRRQGNSKLCPITLMNECDKKSKNKCKLIRCIDKY